MTLAVISDRHRMQKMRGRYSFFEFAHKVIRLNNKSSFHQNSSKLCTILYVDLDQGNYYVKGIHFHGKLSGFEEK